MFGALLTVVFVTLTVATGQQSFSDHGLTPRDDAVLHRQKRFFPLFSVVRFPNSQCKSSNNFTVGTCFTKRECASQGGTAFGSCANGFGVCCVFQKTCGATTSVNNTYFVNPNHPAGFTGGERCTITVNRCNSDICQLRLDFIDFKLQQPTSEGVCDIDLFSVSGGSSRVPRLCGENTDQHVYVNFDGGAPITISVDASADTILKRYWNIKIQQIACDSPWRVPSSCLQYYTSTADTVTSFNYGTVANERVSAAGVIGTREMANLNYGVCVRMATGYCSIRWSATDANSFSVSGDGTALTAASGMSCTTDFIIIPNPTESDATMPGVDRFCGSSFTPKTVTLKPFVLYVVTDNTETTSTVPDTQNKGFSLMYKQMMCSI